MTVGSVDPQGEPTPPAVAVSERRGVMVACVMGRLDHSAMTELRAVVDGARLPVVVDCVAVRGVEPPALTDLDGIARVRHDVVLRRVPAELRAALAARGLDELVAYAER